MTKVKSKSNCLGNRFSKQLLAFYMDYERFFKKKNGISNGSRRKGEARSEREHRRPKVEKRKATL